jgi:acetyl esterase
MAVRSAEALLTPAMRDVLSRMARANRPPFHTITPAAGQGRL